MKAEAFKKQLILKIALLEQVSGIAQTGDLNTELIPGHSDIDLFILCTTIPSEEERRGIYDSFSGEYSECTINVCRGGYWGYGDILLVGGIEVMPMYFTYEEMYNYLAETLEGKHVEKDGGFYPTGRLASVETINILYEENSAWTSLVELVKKTPEELFEKLFCCHISQVIDEEDLGRVLLRREVLFFHQVLENAMDHYLQALFALNHTYFPSRKRNEAAIRSFKKQPINLYERLSQIIKNASSPEMIEEAVKDLKNITAETMELSK